MTRASERAARSRFRPFVEPLEARLCLASNCCADFGDTLAAARERLEDALRDLEAFTHTAQARALIDDVLENNDTRSTAANLGTVSGNQTRSLVLADNADWFRFRLGETGRAGDGVSLQFSHALGDIDVELYNAAGTRLARSQGVTNNEFLSLEGRAAGQYYIRVYGYRGVTNPAYQLRVNVSQAPTDDRLENNDTFAAATNLGTLSETRTVSQLVLADSADWFRFTTGGPGTANDFVSIQFAHAQGDLDLALYNSRGERIRLAESVTNNERVSLNGLGAGTYYVHVYGYRGALNPSYALTIDPAVQIVTPPPPPPAAGGFQIDVSYSGLTSSQQAIFEQAADRWAEVITGDLPSVVRNGVTIDDLLIRASAVSIDGRGGILGQAGPSGLRSGSRLPYYGEMQFDSADLAEMERNGSLLDVILHEMGHVLGIGTIWDTLGLLQGEGTSNPVFTGPQATAEFNAIFGANARGVPVESDGGPGTRDAHWDEELFGNELMSGFIATAANPLSRVTVASLADMGYTVNIAAADPFTPRRLVGTVTA